MTTPTLTYRAAGSGVRVDLDRLVASRMLVQANSGGGKSRAIRQLLEETHGRVQQLVIDPEGEFVTLREKFDYIIAAKTGGDAIVAPKYAKRLCRMLVELNASAVLDLYDLPLDERRWFVENFLTELMALPRNLWRPIIVVIDEMHVFAPEVGQARSAEAVTALATQGRKRGFALVGATQRISKLHKDVAAELLNKMIGRTGLDIDVKRAGDELGMGKEERAALKTLAPGEFFVYGPAISNEVAKVRTGDVVTSHPEAGRIGAVPPPPSAKVRAMLAQLADLPKEAEQEARTIEDLKRDNAKLRGDLTRAQKAQPAALTKTIEKPVVDQRAIERAVATAVMPYRKLIIRVQHQMQGVVQAVKLLPDRLEAVVVTLGEVEQMNGHHVSGTVSASTRSGLSGPSRRESPVDPLAVPRREQPAVATGEDRRASRSREARAVSDGDVSGVERNVLNTLAGLEALGVDEPDKVTVGALCGYSNIRSKSLMNAFGALRSSGRVSYPSSERIALTEEGRAMAENRLQIASVEELHRTWYNLLGGVSQKILEQLVAAYPEALAVDDVAREAGYENARSKSFANARGRLRTLGLVDYPTSGEIVATALLFPEALV